MNNSPVSIGFTEHSDRMLGDFGWCDDPVKGKFVALADAERRMHCVISIAPPTSVVLHAPLVRQKLNALFNTQLIVNSHDDLPEDLKQYVMGGGIVTTSKEGNSIVVKTEFKSPGIEALVGSGRDTPDDPDVGERILGAIQEWAQLLAERGMKKWQA